MNKVKLLKHQQRLQTIRQISLVVCMNDHIKCQLRIQKSLIPSKGNSHLGTDYCTHMFHQTSEFGIYKLGS